MPDVEKRLKALQARGGKLVVVDPRRSETAAMADQHLFVRPGGDAALLCGLLNTLFEENLGRATHLPVQGLDEVRDPRTPQRELAAFRVRDGKPGVEITAI